MTFLGKRWLCPAGAEDEAAALGRALGILPAAARVLINRGIRDTAAAASFLNPAVEQLASPWLMLGMEQAVDRIGTALEQDQKILVHGDYDADGITATAMLVETLRALGGRVDYYLPSRFDEGYGLHREALERFKDDGVNLVITVDCGINATAEAEHARRLGLDLIVTDHHQLLGAVPQEAAAVINPHQPGCPYPFKELSGAGIAFQLAAALQQKYGKGFPAALLDLAALGTVADMVPLLGDNRVLAALGIAAMNAGARPGIKALIRAAALAAGQITSRSVAFVLAPSLNAAGRLGEADPAVALLLAQDESEAMPLAEQLREENRRRRAIEQHIQEEAEAEIAASGAANEKVITLAREGWHHGVIGIVASRLVERYHRPVVMIGLSDGEGRGSARSIPGFNITAALDACAPLLERYGGHAQAAGLTIDPSQVAALHSALNRYAADHLCDTDLIPPLYLEGEALDEELCRELACQLSALEPFGSGNPVPIFMSRDWVLRSWRQVGAEQSHLKLELCKDKHAINPIFFGAASLAPALRRGRTLDLAFSLQDSVYQGEPVLDIFIKDIRYSDSAGCASLEVVDRRGRRDRLRYLKELLPGCRDVAVYISTNSRQADLEQRLPRNTAAIYLTGGMDYNTLEPAGGFAELILYDLPLDERVIEYFLKHSLTGKKLTVYLLYTGADRRRNRLLMDLALPSADALEQVRRALAESAAAGELPGAVAGKLPFQPGRRFWQRCMAILDELKSISEAGCEAAGAAPDAPGWPACLEKSASYRQVMELRQHCEHCQERFLTASPQELACRWAGLLKEIKREQGESEP